MRIIRNLATLLALVTLAATVGIGWANAQEFQGRFTLPFHTQWGNVKLQPGKYNLTLQPMADRVPIVVISKEGAGNHQTRIVGMPVSHAATHFGDGITLSCVPWGTKHFVRSLTIGPRSQVLYFVVPKGALISARNADEHAGTQLETISVKPTVR